jgi:putative transposase
MPYHITQRGTNRERVFFTVADRLLYLRVIREHQADAGVRILAYCLMTNHIHFVAIPEREDSLAVLFGRANGRYAQAGMVAEPADYRWSSAAAHLRGDPDRSGILDSRFWEKAGGADTWAQLHAQKSRVDQILALRKCTYAGRPFGEEHFLAAMEERFQRKWRRMGHGEREIAKTA